jgi:lipopolysaccharide export system protein LptA
MRTMLLTVAVLACAAIVNGQGGFQGFPLFSKMTVHADTEKQVGRVLQARGHVRIVQGTAEITADEADLTYRGESGPVEIQLRGNVNMQVDISR